MLPNHITAAALSDLLQGGTSNEHFVRIQNTPQEGKVGARQFCPSRGDGCWSFEKAFSSRKYAKLLVHEGKAGSKNERKNSFALGIFLFLHAWGGVDMVYRGYNFQNVPSSFVLPTIRSRYLGPSTLRC